MLKCYFGETKLLVSFLDHHKILRMRLDNYIFVVTHYCLCAAVIDNVICHIHRNGGTSEWVTGRETEGNGWGNKVRRESALDLIKSNC